MNENEIIDLLKTRWVTREELCRLLGLTDTATRVYIRELNLKLASQHSCILSSARTEGYHIPNPKSEEDIRKTIGAVSELKSKAISIFERRKVLEDFVTYAQANFDSPEPLQGSLF